MSDRWITAPGVAIHRQGDSGESDDRVMDLVTEWARLTRELFPEHAAHDLAMTADRGTWCRTCDLTLMTEGGDAL